MRVKSKVPPSSGGSASGRKSQKLKAIRINAKDIHYRVLNEKIHRAIDKGYKKIILENVCGQRYIGDGIQGKGIEIVINGVPGNDLAAFMDGPKIIVKGNAQDGVGNTMNTGEVIIYGDAGDITGLAMRGGRIFVKGDVGYRVGIHMKAYKNLFPVVIVGGRARDFLGEYMAGGLLVVLGLQNADYGLTNSNNSQINIVGDFIGTGMHGGTIFIRGEVDARCLGREVKITQPTKDDLMLLETHLADFCKYFNFNLEVLLKKSFVKLYPYTHRPYGKLYAY
jgi:glutamate synthase domain-containing protein 3